MDTPGQDIGGRSHYDTSVGNNHSDDEHVDIDNDNISVQIGKALQNFVPYFTRQIHETMESVVTGKIANMIKEDVASVVKAEIVSVVQGEFDKRFPQLQGGHSVTPLAGVEGIHLAESSSKKEYNFKHFSVCYPPEYNGNPDPIVSFRWISEIEGSFRTTQCPAELKTIYGASMLRGPAKRWWDEQITIKGEEFISKLSWSDFKQEFYNFFCPEGEVARLCAEFLTTHQGSMDLNSFKTQFLDKARFCPEYLGNDKLLKELFHRLLRKDLRERISIVQMKSFTELFNVARGFEVEQAQVGDFPQKRRFEQITPPGKKFKGGSVSGESQSRIGNTPCGTCGRVHSGVCRGYSKNCFMCGKPGHLMRDCTYQPPRVIVCYHCHKEGHRKSSCPSLSEEERRAELRIETERNVARVYGAPKGRCYRLV